MAEGVSVLVARPQRNSAGVEKTGTVFGDCIPIGSIPGSKGVLTKTAAAATGISMEIGAIGLHQSTLRRPKSPRGPACRAVFARHAGGVSFNEGTGKLHLGVAGQMAGGQEPNIHARPLPEGELKATGPFARRGPHANLARFARGRWKLSGRCGPAGRVKGGKRRKEKESPYGAQHATNNRSKETPHSNNTLSAHQLAGRCDNRAGAMLNRSRQFSASSRRGRAKQTGWQRLAHVSSKMSPTSSIQDVQRFAE